MGPRNRRSSTGPGEHAPNPLRFVEEIVGDFVRLIRTFRPDVLLTMNIQGRGGDRAHEATTVKKN